MGTSACAQDCVAYRRATIETLGKGGRIENATLVVRGGKIEAIGKDVKIPDDAKVVDAAGCTIMPGVIEPYFELPIAGSGGDAGQPQTIVVRGRTITLPGQARLPGASFTRVADNLNPYDRVFRPFVRSGLVGMNLVASGQGQAAVIQLTPATPEQMLVQPEGVLFASVSNQSDSLDIVRARLESVARLKRTGGTTPGATSPASAGGPAGGGILSQMTNQMKPWVDVYEGKAPVFVHVANAATVAHLAKVMPTHKDVRWVLLGTGDCFAETIDALRGQKVTVIVRPGLELEPNTRNRMNIAARLYQAGIPFAFSQTGNLQAAGGAAGAFGGAAGGGNPTADLMTSQDFPLFTVAMLVKCGLPRQAALEALTLRPAQLLGLEQTLGSIESGKAASFLVFQGDPLDPQSRLKTVLIGGKTAYEN